MQIERNAQIRIGRNDDLLQLAWYKTMAMRAPTYNIIKNI